MNNTINAKRVNLLSEFTRYSNIVVQCHNFPDADAVGSGFAVYSYFKSKGVNVRLVYSGPAQISKANLKLIVKKLNIPIEYVDSSFKVDGLLITVDCQYGDGNVTKLEADDVLIIDHHTIGNHFLEGCNLKNCYIIVKERYASCASVVYQLLQKENFRLNMQVSTALYYGVFMDTNEFSEVREPADREIRDELLFDDSLITLVKNSNLNAKELMIAGKALQNYTERGSLALIEAHECDPNILGLIADMLIRVENITTAIVFNKICSNNRINVESYKFSVRTCIGENRANEIAEMICAPVFKGKKLGGGGGHRRKAGGWVDVHTFNELVESKNLNISFKEYIYKCFDEYTSKSRIIYCDSYDYNSEKLMYRRYKRKSVVSGFVRSNELACLGTSLLIRTPVGDVHEIVSDELYLKVGAHGEVYPYSKKEFFQNYKECNESIDVDGYMLNDDPKVLLDRIGVKVYLSDFLHPCKVRDARYVYARKITLDDKTVKLLPSKWGYSDFIFGNFGDYIVVSADNLKNVSIVSSADFEDNFEKIN